MLKSSMSNTIDPRLTPATRGIIQNAEGFHGTQGDIRWGSAAPANASGQVADALLEPVVPQSVMDRALCHVAAGDRSDMNGIFHTLEQVSQDLGGSSDPAQQVAGARVAQANQAFAQSMAARWEQVESGAVACAK